MSRRFKTGPKLLVLMLLVAAVAGLWFWTERTLVFGPARPWGETPAAAGLPYEEELLAASGGLDLRAWYIRAPTNEVGLATNDVVTVLCLHDAGETISDFVPVARVFHDLGLAVLLPEYRGFGGNPGRPSEEGLTLDALAAYVYLTARRSVPPERLVLYGRGVGAAVAMDLATQVRAAGLITDSAFTSLGQRVAKVRQSRLIPWDLVFERRFAGLLNIGRVHMPVLFLHAENDPVVPVRQAERLYGACRGQKRLVVVEELPPGQPLVGSPDSRAAMRLFLAQCTSEPAAATNTAATAATP